jgi:SAM-dependent methyltransferase
MDVKETLPRKSWLTACGWCILFVLVSVQACRSPQDSKPSSTTHQADLLALEPDSLSGEFTDWGLSERENWQKPQVVISALGDLHDKVVADIGAGTGYFTLPLARVAKKVIAVDIEQLFLEHIRKRLARIPEREALEVDIRHTIPDNPALKPSEADVVLLVNTYSFIDRRVQYFDLVKRGLSRSGRMVVVDFKHAELPVGPPLEEKITPLQIIQELDSAGFRHVSTDSNSLEYQFIVVVEKKP